jgi:hypothetical protein
MKMTFLSSGITTTLLALTAAATLAWAAPVAAAEHERPNFGFKANTPDDWQVFGERKNKEQMLIDFSLPSVWSEADQQQIEHSVYVKAYRESEVSSMADVIRLERKHNSRMVLSAEPLMSSVIGQTFMVRARIRGVEYKILETYYYANGTGYLIGFTATQTTFDANVDQYYAFLKQLQFMPVSADSEVDQTSASVR